MKKIHRHQYWEIRLHLYYCLLITQQVDHLKGWLVHKGCGVAALQEILRNIDYIHLSK